MNKFIFLFGYPNGSRILKYSNNRTLFTSLKCITRYRWHNSAINENNFNYGSKLIKRDLRCDTRGSTIYQKCRKAPASNDY